MTPLDAHLAPMQQRLARRPPRHGRWLLAVAACAVPACGEGLLLGNPRRGDDPLAAAERGGAPDLRSLTVTPPVPDSGAPTEPDAAPAPQPAARLGVGEIVGGAYTVSQPYGPTSFWMDYGYCLEYGHWPAGQNVHCAVDIPVARGTRIYAPDHGTVTVAGGTPWYNDDLNPAAGDLRVELADGTEVVFGHMSTIEVAIGQSVSPHTPLGKSGSAGTGPHLHLEVRLLAPDCAVHDRHTADPLEHFGR